MASEQERAELLLSAQANAVALFDEVTERGLIAAGQGEQAVSDQIRDLANEMFGQTRHWHWILEVHLTDPAGEFGGFYKQLLDLG